MKQGCPFTPYLFILALDALGYLLEDAAKVGRVQGLPMPMGRQLRNYNLADDLVSSVSFY